MSGEGRTRDAAARLRGIDWSGLPAVRDVVFDALGPVLAGEEAARALDRVLRASRGWSALERTAAAEVIFGVSLWRRRLRHHAETDAPVALTSALLAGVAGLDEALATSLTGWTLPLRLDLPEDWPTRWSVPDWLAVELEAALGTEAEPFVAACAVPGPVCIRVNRLRTSRERLAAALEARGIACTPTVHAGDGLVLAGRPNILGLPEHRNGEFEVQDEGSQLVGSLVGARPGDTVLDLCAGSGGKTLLLASEMMDTGRIFAHDVESAALERLEQRCVRAGVRSVRVLRSLPDDLRALRVLVDAPCGALGALRRRPDLRWRIRSESLEAWPTRQRDLLSRAAHHVLPGGRLVYATCTFRRAENEEVTAAFLRAHPDFHALPPPVPPALVEGTAMVCLPHRHDTDGFFAQVFERAAVA